MVQNVYFRLRYKRPEWWMQTVENVRGILEQVEGMADRIRGVHLQTSRTLFLFYWQGWPEYFLQAVVPWMFAKRFAIRVYRRHQGSAILSPYVMVGILREILFRLEKMGREMWGMEVQNLLEGGDEG